jgi:SprT protein
MLTEQKIKEITDKVSQTVEKLNSIYHFNMKHPSIHFDILGTNAGLAKFRTMSVHFNLKLALQNWKDFIENTIPHELCHIAVWQFSIHTRRKIPKPHGATWKLMMWEVGAKPKRTHDYDVSEVKRGTKLYQYDCGCTNKVEVSHVIHNRIVSGKKYKCTICKKMLINGQRKITKSFSRPRPNGTTQTKVD